MSDVCSGTRVQHMNTYRFTTYIKKIPATDLSAFKHYTQAYTQTYTHVHTPTYS